MSFSMFVKRLEEDPEFKRLLDAERDRLRIALSAPTPTLTCREWSVLFEDDNHRMVGSERMVRQIFAAHQGRRPVHIETRVVTDWCACR